MSDGHDAPCNDSTIDRCSRGSLKTIAITDRAQLRAQGEVTYPASTSPHLPPDRSSPYVFIPPLDGLRGYITVIAWKPGIQVSLYAVGWSYTELSSAHNHPIMSIRISFGIAIIHGYSVLSVWLRTTPIRCT
jgi:hypothetical protein